MIVAPKLGKKIFVFYRTPKLRTMFTRVNHLSVI